MKFSNILCIMFILIVIMSLPVNAYTLDDDYSTSGTIEYQVSQSNTYSLSPQSNVGGGYNMTTVVCNFDYAKNLYRIRLLDMLTRADSDIAVGTYSSFTAYVDDQYYGHGIIGLTDAYPVVSPYYVYLDIRFTDVDEAYAQTLTYRHFLKFDYELDFTNVTGYEGTVAYNSGMPLVPDEPVYFQCEAAGQVMGSYPAPKTVFCSWNDNYINEYSYDYNSTTQLAHLEIFKNNCLSLWNVSDINTTYVDEGATYTDNDIEFYFSPNSTVYAYVTYNIDGGVTETELIHLLDFSTTEETLNLDGYSIEWGRDDYTLGETGYIYYSDVPENSTIYIIGYSGDSSIGWEQETQYLINNVTSVTGYKTYTFSNKEAIRYRTGVLYNGHEYGEPDYTQVSMSPTSAIVYGYVYDTETGSRIEDANVHIYYGESLEDTELVHTDELGKYSVSCEKGLVELYIHKSGFNDFRQQFTVTENTVRNIGLTYETDDINDGVLYGYVVSYESGEVDNATVYASIGNVTSTTYTNEYGYYKFPVYFPQNTTGSIIASCDGYTTYTNRSINITENRLYQTCVVHDDDYLTSGDVVGDSTYDAETSELDTIPNNVMTFVASKTFMALFIIVIIAYLFGGTGEGFEPSTLILSLPVGIIICVFAQLLPVWMIYFIILMALLWAGTRISSKLSGD